MAAGRLDLGRCPLAFRTLDAGDRVEPLGQLDPLLDPVERGELHEPFVDHRVALDPVVLGETGVRTGVKPRIKWPPAAYRGPFGCSGDGRGEAIRTLDL